MDGGRVGKVAFERLFGPMSESSQRLTADDQAMLRVLKDAGVYETTARLEDEVVEAERVASEASLERVRLETELTELTARLASARAKEDAATDAVDALRLRLQGIEHAGRLAIEALRKDQAAAASAATAAAKAMDTDLLCATCGASGAAGLAGGGDTMGGEEAAGKEGTRRWSTRAMSAHALRAEPSARLRDSRGVRSGGDGAASCMASCLARRWGGLHGC